MFDRLIGYIPIRFGVKQSTDGNNYLYVVIDDNGIKKTEFMHQHFHATHGQGTGSPVTFSIAEYYQKQIAKITVCQRAEKGFSTRC